MVSLVMRNGGVTSDIALTRSVHQGCPISPLLFAIVTHPLLVMLSRLATNGDIVGLHLPSGGRLVVSKFLTVCIVASSSNSSSLHACMALSLSLSLSYAKT